MMALIRTITYVIISTLFLLPLAPAPGEGGRIETDLKRGMVLIPAGEYLMGSNPENGFIEIPPEEAPRHPVYVSAFYIDRYEVTNREFASFLNKAQPSEEKRKGWIVLRSDLADTEVTLWPAEIEYSKGRYVPVRGFEDYPVVTVSWFGAEAYCRWAGKRLPTEAEWEKAARGGLKGKLYPWGNAIPTMDNIVYGRSWSDNTYPAPVEPVNSYLPNGYGLYHISGNVWEWCSDWYDPEYYKKSPRKDPRGPENGTVKSVRGGGWSSDALQLRVAFRGFSAPGRLDPSVGFRCAGDAK